MATVEGPSLAYLTLRPAEPVDGQKRYEIGLIGHGPDGIALADITAEEAARWDREYRSRSVRFEIPIGRAGEHAPDKGRFVIDRPHHPSPSSGNRAMLAGTTAHRFPLVARSRPLCTALPARIGALADLAARAQHDNDLTAAARVYNQAALIASDCGQTDLARQWCHRHAQAWLDRPDLTTTPGRHVIESLVNLARLHIRAGEHDDGLTLLTELYHAIAHRTDTTIDGIPLPAAALTPTEEAHRDLTQWLWSVHLADGTRALTSAGRWDDAEEHLQHHHGIGNRMLDGRQAAIIARIHRGQHAAAQQMIDTTQPGEPWEAAVAACLTTMSHPDGPARTEDVDLMTARYQKVSRDPSLVVFRTRLALSIVELVRQPPFGIMVEVRG
ncbi:hypothetical protein KSK32_32505 [Micromonospora sp. WMMB482]|nr:hypothetical protein [Micromonospora sp. WMMB482]MBU8861891.1 hypothetical protein [Micromonospora sp. WMMB482]